MTKRFAGKWIAMGLAVATAVAMPVEASAHDGYGRGDWHHRGWDHDGWRHDHGDWHRDRDDWHRGHGHRGGYWSGGRWIAGAIVTGTVAGIVSDALQPAPVYEEPSRTVIYSEPRTVIYDESPVTTRRIVTTRTVVEGDPYPLRYGDDDDDD